MWEKRQQAGKSGMSHMQAEQLDKQEQQAAGVSL
jgi:hypothetical protein